MADSGSNGKKGKGFAGLDSMVSDVSDDVEKATKAHPPKASAREPPPSEPSPRPVRPEPRPAPAESSPPPGSGKSGLGWVIVAVIVLVIWIANSGSGNKSQPAPSYGLSSSSSYSSPTPPAPTPAPAAPVSDDQKPPVGRDNILNIPQIRWCKREKTRIEAIESVINNAYDHEVDRFNARVSDYNSRCGEFRSRRGNVEQVDRELTSERESIASKAKSEWVRQSLGLDAPENPSRQNKANTKTQTAKPKQPVTKPKEAKPACSQDNECPGALFCVRGACGTQVDFGELCDRDIECGPLGSKCMSGRCAGASAAAPSLSPSNSKQAVPAAPEQPNRKGGMPANAKIDYTGHNWECERGYRKVGNECRPL